MGEQPRRFRVIAAEEGMTLRQVLRRRLPELAARGLAQDLIRAGGVYLDKVRVRLSGIRVVEGERISVYLDADKPPLDLAELTVLARGSDYLAVDKPAGVPVRASKASARGTVSEAVVRLLRTQGIARPYVGVVHPLPAAVGGAVLLTIRGQQQSSMLNAFIAQPSQRTFYAQLTGTSPTTAADLTISELADLPGTVAIEVSASIEVATLLARLRTRGTPVIGDGSAPKLHCMTLAAKHPVSGEPIRVESQGPAWAKRPSQA